MGQFNQALIFIMCGLLIFIVWATPHKLWYNYVPLIVPVIVFVMWVWGVP